MRDRAMGTGWLATGVPDRGAGFGAGRIGARLVRGKDRSLALAVSRAEDNRSLGLAGRGPGPTA